MLDEILLQQRLDAFNPSPLIEDDNTTPVEIEMIKEDANNIDLAKANYLNLLNNDTIKRASEEIIRKYGVGTCGPRAFYGTTDVHLELEERLAEFLHVEETIIYSYGFVAISSSIAAYCKKNDVIFVSDQANFPIEQGILAAKSRIIRFANNNPDDLKRKLDEFCANDKRKSRKFLIIEGISWQTGELCPLPEFLEIAERFKLRVFLEESYTIGIFGATGRGLTELYNIDPYRLDMIFGTLEGAIGSIGGFCAGASLIIDPQRLAGSGYIFSASLPTYLVNVVLKSLELIQEQPKQLQQLTKDFHQFLIDSCGFNVISHELAPFKIIKFDDNHLKMKIYQFCKDAGVHFIQRENDLMINLNVALLEDKERYQKVLDTFKKASELLV